MRIELDFEGDSSGADKAAGTIDASLQALERTTRDLVAILKQIRLDAGNVTQVVTGSKAMKEAVDGISDAANRAARDVKDVKYGPGQAAAFAAESAVMAAAVDRVGDSAKRSRDELLGMSMIARSVLGGTPTPPKTLMAAFASGNNFQGYTQSRSNPITGVVSDTRGVEQAAMDARRRIQFNDFANDPFTSRSEGSFGLSGGDARGSGGGNDIGNFIRRLRGGDDGNGRGSGGGNLFGGAGNNLFGGILPGGRRAGFGALTGLAALGTSVAEPVGLGAVGILASLPTLITGIGGAVAVLAGSLKGLGSAIDGNQKDFENLDKTSQSFVQSVRAYEPFLEKLQATARSNVLPGLTSALNSALSPSTGGLLQYGAATFGRSVSNVAQKAGSFLGSSGFSAEMVPLINAGAADFEKMATAAGKVFNALLKLGDAGIPIANWLSDSAVKMGDWLNKMLDGAAATGRLTQIMGNAKTALSDVGGLIASLAKVLYNLAAALGPVGDEILRLVTDGLNHLSDWLAKNRDEITNFVQTALNVLVATLKILWTVVTDVVSALVKVFKAISDLTGGAIGLNTVLAGIVSLGLASWAFTAAQGMGALKDAMLLMARSPEIAALIVGLAALAALKSLQGNAPAYGGTFPGSTTNTANITGKRKTNADEVIALRKKGMTDQQIQAYLNGDSGAKAMKGFPQFGKSSSGDIAMGSAFTDANALTVGQGTKGAGIMPATTEAGNPSSSLLQGPHHTDGFPGTGRTAVDIAATIGAPVLAPEDGQVTRDSGSAPKTGSNNINGYSLYYQGVSGTIYFMTHMSWVASPGAYKKGDKIGVIASGTQGGPHLHIDYNAPINLAHAGSTPTSTNTKGTPPPFTPTAQNDVLPNSYQLAIAKASTTTGTADDVRAIKAAIAYLSNGRIGALDPTQQTLAYQEKGSLVAQLASLAKKAVSGRASVSSRLSASNAGTGILGLIGQAGGSAASLLPGDPSSPASMIAAMPLLDARTKFAPLLADWKKQIADFEVQLRDKTISSAAVSTITTRMTEIKSKVTSALADIKTAAATQAANFKAIWADYVSSFDESFDKTTSDVLANPQKYAALLPLSAALADLQDSHTQQQLQKALTDAQAQLATALGGSGDNAGVLSRARDALGKDALAHAIDVAQSAILGGQPADMTAQILKDMQDALAAGAPDPQAVLNAQQAVADAQYNIKVDGLTKQASAEQQAYSDSRSELKKHLDAALALWGTYYANSGKTAGQALALLNGLLAQYGFAPVTDPFVNTTGGFTAPPGTPGGGPAPGSTIQSGIPPGTGARGGTFTGFASGGVITKPHFLVDAATGQVTGMMSENGPERISRMGGDAASSTGSVNVDVHFANGMEWLSQFIDVRVASQGDRVSQAVGKDADRRRREGAYRGA